MNSLNDICMNAKTFHSQGLFLVVFDGDLMLSICVVFFSVVISLQVNERYSGLHFSNSFHIEM